LVAALALVVCTACGGRAKPAEPADGAKVTAVRRLDGSEIRDLEIDATVARLMSAARVPGVALAIIQDGQVAYQKAYGWRNVEQRLPMTVDTAIGGASFTKAAFALLVMQLVEQGRLDLDRPIEEYLGKPLVEFEGYRDLAGDVRARRFTARMLLSHTAGMPNWRRFNPDQRLDIKFEPGTRYAYSGEGIAVLQMVVEAITGRSIGGQMTERVFGRFGMTRSSMVWRAEFEANHSLRYDARGAPVPWERRISPDAAGSMTTTVRDWAKLLAGLLRGEGLSRSSWEEMLRPQVRIHSRRQFPPDSRETTEANDAIRLSYGLGWGLFFTPYGRAYFKEGHDDGVQNHCVSFDVAGSAIVVMTNSDNGEPMFPELLAKLLGDTFTPGEWEGYVR
jgi:CubicO group peptidase (beta-lactamase class C family)